MKIQRMTVSPESHQNPLFFIGFCMALAPESHQNPLFFIGLRWPSSQKRMEIHCLYWFQKPRASENHKNPLFFIGFRRPGTHYFAGRFPTSIFKAIFIVCAYHFVEGFLSFGWFAHTTKMTFPPENSRLPHYIFKLNLQVSLVRVYRRFISYYIFYM